MTDNNLFQEVREDLERQKLQALWNEYGVWLIIAALGVVLATGGTTAYKSWQASNNQKVTSELLSAVQTNKDRTKTLELLESVAASHPGAPQSDLALLRAGSMAADQNDKDKAIRLFDQVAADPKADPSFRQLGDLFSVQLQMDTVDPAVLSARLQPLTEDHATWRYSALEDQGYLALRAGDRAKAKDIFTDLSHEATAPSTIVSRAADIARSLN